MFLAIILLFVNLGISWFNAWSVGRTWADTKAMGGWARLLAWCGAAMSACGFTYVYLTILSMLAVSFHVLPPQYARAALELGYVMIILPLLGSGLGITINSIATAWRRRDLMSIGMAGYNTYAQIYNTYAAATTLPGVLSDLNRTFNSDDEDSGPATYLVILLVAFAIGGGILTTSAIIRATARKYAQTVRASFTAGPSIYGWRAAR
jgi:hypothetical protein